MKPIRHVNQLGTRVREQGRLRMGVKTGNAMKALKHWRFTSPEKEPLDQLAALYGGEVRPWSDAKAGQGPNQFELLSTSEKIRCFVPPGGLSTWYEQWAGGGVQRRCDGETLFVGGDETQAVPCKCDAEQVMLCKPKTRLSVVLPEISPFGGVWRLDTGSWNAADELAAMEQMLDSLQYTGLVEAQLLIEPRSKMKGGKKTNFVVPVMLISASAQQALNAPGGQLLTRELATPDLPALSAGGNNVTDESRADEPVDAQIVDLPDYDRGTMDDRLVTALDLITQRGELTYDQVCRGFALTSSKGQHDTIEGLPDSLHAKVVAVAEDVAQGKRKILGLGDDDRLRFG